MRIRYIAAIVANCYFNSFNRWPVTPKGYPKRDYLRCPEQVWAVLDKRNLYGIRAACKEFVVDPWELWEETPPFTCRQIISNLTSKVIIIEVTMSSKQHLTSK